MKVLVYVYIYRAERKVSACGWKVFDCHVLPRVGEAVLLLDGESEGEIVVAVRHPTDGSPPFLVVADVATWPFDDNRRYWLEHGFEFDNPPPDTKILSAPECLRQFIEFKDDVYADVLEFLKTRDKRCSLEHQSHLLTRRVVAHARGILLGENP